MDPLFLKPHSPVWRCGVCSRSHELHFHGFAFQHVGLSMLLHARFAQVGHVLLDHKDPVFRFFEAPKRGGVSAFLREVVCIGTKRAHALGQTS